MNDQPPLRKTWNESSPRKCLIPAIVGAIYGLLWRKVTDLSTHQIRILCLCVYMYIFWFYTNVNTENYSTESLGAIKLYDRFVPFEADKI